MGLKSIYPNELRRKILLQMIYCNVSVTLAVTPINPYDEMSCEKMLQRYSDFLYPYTREKIFWVVKKGRVTRARAVTCNNHSIISYIIGRMVLPVVSSWQRRIPHMGRRMKQLPDRKIESDEIGYIGNMLRWGASVSKICETLGMSEAEFRRQLESDGELASVVKEAKLMRDTDIQRAFFEAAVGGFHTSTQKKYIQKEDGTKQMEVVEKTEYSKPDPKLMALMLKNIDPWFAEKDGFERKLALESQLIRKQLAGREDWKPLTTRLRGTVRMEGEILSPAESKENAE